jgi:hypothetical protein
MTHALLFNRSCTRLSAHGPSKPPLIHFSKSLGQIQNLDPDHLMSRLKSKTTPAKHFQLDHAPIDAWIQKMDVDADGGRREFGLRA